MRSGFGTQKSASRICSRHSGRILTSSIKECLEALETQKKELEARIAEERLANLKLSPDFVRF